MAKHKVAAFNVEMSPIAFSLKQSSAASIGRTIAMHSYLQTLQASIVHKLLSVSVKQGRVVYKVPLPRVFATHVRDLLQFHHALPDYNFGPLVRKLEAADVARNMLAHSIYLTDKATGRAKIQIVKGNWELDQQTFPVSRTIMPETRVLDRAFLGKQRAAVEAAIPAVKELQLVVWAALAASNEIRKRVPRLDRRHHPTD